MPSPAGSYSRVSVRVSFPPPFLRQLSQGASHVGDRSLPSRRHLALAPYPWPWVPDGRSSLWICPVAGPEHSARAPALPAAQL